MKKVLAVVQVLLLVLTVHIYAEENGQQATVATTNEELVFPHEMIDRLFQKQFTFWSNDHADITNAFYGSMTAYYQSQNYEAITDFIRENVLYAEHIEVEQMARSTNIMATVERYAGRVLVDSTYGEVQLELWYFVDLTVLFNDDTALIVHAYTPDVWQITYPGYAGWYRPTVWSENEVGTVTSNGHTATFTFDICAEQEYETWQDGLPNGENFYYEWNVTEVVYIDDLDLSN